MTLRPSRRGLVPPFIAMDVLRAANERQAAGAEIVHLEVGQPGSSAPAPVLEAARRALVSEPIGYTDALGIPPLRQEIAAHYQTQYGVPVDPGEVVVTTGSSAAFLLIFLAAFEPGDRVGLAIPGYPAYRNILSALGIEPVLIAVGENLGGDAVAGMQFGGHAGVGELVVHGHGFHEAWNVFAIERDPGAFDGEDRAANGEGFGRGGGGWSLRTRMAASEEDKED